MSKELYEHRARVFKALAHPTRLALMEALSQGERCVCELQGLLGEQMPTISKHLGVLRAAGLIADRKEGLWVHYRLACPCLPGFLECVDTVLQREAETHRRVAELAGGRER